MAAHPIDAQMKFILSSALGTLTAGIHLALTKIGDDRSDLRDGLSGLLDKAHEILGGIIEGAHEQ